VTTNVLVSFAVVDTQVPASSQISERTCHVWWVVSYRLLRMSHFASLRAEIVFRFDLFDGLSHLQR
jgi:hypothetical protein